MAYQPCNIAVPEADSRIRPLQSDYFAPLHYQASQFETKYSSQAQPSWSYNPPPTSSQSYPNLSPAAYTTDNFSRDRAFDSRSISHDGSRYLSSNEDSLSFQAPSFNNGFIPGPGITTLNTSFGGLRQYQAPNQSRSLSLSSGGSSLSIKDERSTDGDRPLPSGSSLLPPANLTYSQPPHFTSPLYSPSDIGNGKIVNNNSNSNNSNNNSNNNNNISEADESLKADHTISCNTLNHNDSPLNRSPPSHEPRVSSLAPRRTYKSRFTPEQDSLILNLRKKGKSWSEIADAAKVEGPMTARNRYRTLVGPHGRKRNVNWDDDDVLVLRELLEAGERAKWKFISAQLSNSRQKRVTSTACQKKFLDMFGVAESSSVLGSSLCYVAHETGWDCLYEDNDSSQSP
ncbi:hypothetical protein NADFUDRAFT_43026 [Nadsonia fulvescens var. elongata DSM 6958]|uniref:Myb-like domain-containing protein n=1 Tax=Nadsonia fulvescens var. elongata DSM 6958 TaxID=857566 RepID=A0A1E3PHN2_9ASCO|nr:hypothetical protein NADFUDRAFT_43026 [Nadsonia fulvescens var. elongata DSM 6958]